MDPSSLFTQEWDGVVDWTEKDLLHASKYHAWWGPIGTGPPGRNQYYWIRKYDDGTIENSQFLRWLRKYRDMMDGKPMTAEDKYKAANFWIWHFTDELNHLRNRYPYQFWRYWSDTFGNPLTTWCYDGGMFLDFAFKWALETEFQCPGVPEVVSE